MANVLEKLRDFMFGEAVYDDYDDENEKTNEASKDSDISIATISDIRNNAKKASKNNIVDFNQEARTYILRVAPKSFDEVRHYCDCLKNRKILIVDLENVEHNTAQRIMDFLSGSAYAIEGTIEKAGTHVYIVAHKAADIQTSNSKDESSAKSGGALSWIASYK